MHVERCDRTSDGGADGSDSLHGILEISLSNERYRENPLSLNTKKIQKYERKGSYIFLNINSLKLYLIKIFFSLMKELELFSFFIFW